jgi:hypothetical protein
MNKIVWQTVMDKIVWQTVMNKTGSPRLGTPPPPYISNFINHCIFLILFCLVPKGTFPLKSAKAQHSPLQQL